jgi:uncharacterized protein (DUF1697 family)
MPTFIALLRAVNLGPHNKVAMADLRELLDDLARIHHDRQETGAAFLV